MNNRVILGCITCLLVLGAVFQPTNVESDDSKPAAAQKDLDLWPSWRGPHQNGYSDDTRVPLKWSDKENLKWKIDLPGLGNSSPIVWQNRIFLTSATKDGSERYVFCIDRGNGKVLWQQNAAKGVTPERTHEWNTHASATCVTDGERVYAFFGTPGVFCYDFDGKLLWKRDFGVLGSSTSWGVGGASPVLFEDLVIVNGDQGGMGGQKGDAGGKDYGPSYLWAMNKRTGDIVWKTERNQGMGWCTPIFLTTAGGRLEMILNSPRGVYSYDPRTGKELWHTGGRAPDDLFGEITPVWTGDTIIALTGRPGPMHAVRMGGSGDVTKTHIAWTTDRAGRDVSSPIIVGEQLYALSARRPDGILTCYEAKTGKELWKQRLAGQPCASPIYVRGKIIFLSEEGTAHVLEPGPEFKLLGTNKLGSGDEFFRASPAVVDGQLLIRSDRRLYCIEGKE